MTPEEQACYDSLRTRCEFLLGMLDVREKRLAAAEALLRKWLDGSRMDGWDAHEAWQEVSDFLSPDSATHRENERE